MIMKKIAPKIALETVEKDATTDGTAPSLAQLRMKIMNHVMIVFMLGKHKASVWT